MKTTFKVLLSKVRGAWKKYASRTNFSIFTQDETKYWNFPVITGVDGETAQSSGVKAIHTVYIVDANVMYNVCSLTPVYEANEIGHIPIFNSDADTNKHDLIVEGCYFVEDFGYAHYFESFPQTILGDSDKKIIKRCNFFYKKSTPKTCNNFWDRMQSILYSLNQKLNSQEFLSELF